MSRQLTTLLVLCLVSGLVGSSFLKSANAGLSTALAVVASPTPTTSSTVPRPSSKRKTYPKQETVAPGEHAIIGTFRLSGSDDEDFRSSGKYGCSGLGGYSDIELGKQIVITNEDSHILATAILLPHPDATNKECLFQFLADVPDAQYYSFKLGRRGEIVYSKSDLEASKWHVDLELGGG